jgi:hypothetical protein
LIRVTKEVYREELLQRLKPKRRKSEGSGSLGSQSGTKAERVSGNEFTRPSSSAQHSRAESAVEINQKEDHEQTATIALGRANPVAQTKSGRGMKFANEKGYSARRRRNSALGTGCKRDNEK